MMVSGYIDSFEGDIVTGWAWDSQNPSDELFVELSTGNGFKAVVRANLFRQDLFDDGIGDGRHGFYIQLPENITQNSSITDGFTVRVLGSNTYLQHVDVEIGFLKKLSEKWRKRLFENYYISSGNMENSLTKEGKTRFPFCAIIHHINGSQINIWANTPRNAAVPILFVGSTPAWLSPDIHEVTDSPIFNISYTFYVSGILTDDEISLYMAFDNRVFLLESRFALAPFLERSVMQQLTSAAITSKESDSIAILGHDGSNTNLVERCLKFHNLLDSKRIVFLIFFLNDSISLDIVKSLEASQFKIITLPWSRRYFYSQLASSMDVHFGTILMCGTSYKNVLLASMFARTNSKLILDIPEFDIKASPDDLPSAGLSSLFMEKIVARTTDSSLLEEKYTAENFSFEKEMEDYHDAFIQLEEKATLFGALEPGIPTLRSKSTPLAERLRHKPTLLLIWKQHDAGLYGRRIDQICRSYQTLHPDHRIIVLEILNPDIDNVYNSNVDGFSEFTYIREMNMLKSQALFETSDNVQYRQIVPSRMIT